MSVSPAAPSAQMAPAMAMRWSPWLSTTPGADAAAAAHGQAVGVLLDLDAERAQHRRRRGDAIRLLDAQLGGVADARLALGVRGDGGEQRQLVDGAHRQLAGDADGARGAAGARQIGDRLAADEALVGDLDARAHGAERVEHAGARRVDADAAHDDAAARHHRGGAEEERRRRQIAGDHADRARRAGRPSRADRRVTRSPSTVSGAPMCAQHALGVIARALRLDDGGRRRRRRAPASTMADLTCAEATVDSQWMPCRRAAPARRSSSGG